MMKPRPALFSSSKSIPLESLILKKESFTLLCLAFFRSSAGKALAIQEIDYWLLKQYRNDEAPNIAKIIFLSILSVVSKDPQVSTSLPYACVLTHIFAKNDVDFSLDPHVPLKEKIDNHSTQKCGFDFQENRWTYKGEDL
ncbi:hypothetical protein V6N12_012644 [Hibiscus sabdariffa]|uniref:Uncharacterized protein n=1 Tax=Hibiscus sabdariffa TaxID=183260 RepID=A0ABR2DEU2_9ROSI